MGEFWDNCLDSIVDKGNWDWEIGEFWDDCWDSIVDKGNNIRYVDILEVLLEDIGIQ